jgi:hypothetical protein
MAKLLSYFVFTPEDRRTAWDVGGLVKSQLPNPLLIFIQNYHRWIMEVYTLFANTQWNEDTRVKQFYALHPKSELSKPVNTSYIQELKIGFSHQINLIRSLLEFPPQSVFLPELQVNRIRVTFIIAYVLLCSIFDLLVLSYFGPLIWGIVGIEVSMLLGFPSLRKFVAGSKGAGAE